MARRVKQADGSYCYTENCRIHDRSGDSTGLQAVINDAKVSRLNGFAANASKALQSELNLSEDTANKLAPRIIDTVMNSENGVTPYTLSEGIKEAAREEGIDSSDWETTSAAYVMQNNMIQTALIKPGDEVVLNETGERGTITEGNSAFGGTVRFNPESIRSRNSFAWFQPQDVTKVVANDKSLAREQIFAASRDSLVPASLVKQLLDEETSKTTRNAQGLKEVGKQASAARANLLALGDKLEAQFGSRAGLTKEYVVKQLTQAYDSPVDKAVPAAEVKATKSALRNIITYLDPEGNSRS
jgi:hypothetical protein